MRGAAGRRGRGARAWIAAAVGLCCGAAPAARAQDAGSAAPRAGERMLTVFEAGVMEPGEFDVAFQLDNYDRDPLGIDVFDGTFDFRVGVVKRLELRFGYQITRAVSSPGFHPVPSPPLDVVSLDGSAPTGAYRAMYWPMPYLSHHPARVAEMVPGEYTLGARVSVFDQRGARPALSAGAWLTAPGTRARYDLSKGSGTGGIDTGLEAAASWRRGRLSTALDLALTFSHSLDPADQLLGTGSPRTLEIRRPRLLAAGLGLRLRLYRGVSAVGELAGWGPVGAHTPMQGESGASELLGGLLVDVGRATIALGVRWHLRPQPDGTVVDTGPLAGAVDLSDVPFEERAALLEPLGVNGLRHDANTVVVGAAPDAAWPDAAHLVAPTYRTSTRGNAGLAVRVSVRLGR